MMEGPGRGTYLASGLIHLVAAVLFWAAYREEVDPWEWETIAVQIVPSPEPEVDDPAAPDELVVERIEEPPPEPEVEETPPPPPVTEEKKEDPPEPEEKKDDPPPTPPEEKKTETPPKPPEKEEEAELSGEEIRDRMDALERDYPDYYANIQRQIVRCFRWDGAARWEAELQFNIYRDGTLADIDWVRRSGNSRFDLTAFRAIDCAGEEGRIGPLPDGIPGERFPFRFYFTPGG